MQTEYMYAVKASICLIRRAFSFLALLCGQRPMNMLASSNQERNPGQEHSHMLGALN